jgi:hypothetical protein
MQTESDSIAISRALALVQAATSVLELRLCTTVFHSSLIALICSSISSWAMDMAENVTAREVRLYRSYAHYDA